MSVGENIVVYSQDGSRQLKMGDGLRIVGDEIQIDVQSPNLRQDIELIIHDEMRKMIRRQANFWNDPGSTVV